MSSSQPPSPPSLTNLVTSLKIPVEFNCYEEANVEKRKQLDLWKNNVAIRVLGELQTLVGLCLHSGSLKDEENEEVQFGIEERAAVVGAVSPFLADLGRLCWEMVGQGGGSQSISDEERRVLGDEMPWTTPQSRVVAQDIMDLVLQDASKDEKEGIWRHILSNTIKPMLLASNPHPHINPRTGKSLPSSSVGRPPQQGGFASVTQDFYESDGQRWKAWIGLGAVLYQCVANLEERSYETVWHLVVPPLMTFLDDYQPRYKLWGLLAARAMLRHVPVDHLRRTGIDGLLRTSFIKALAYQDSPLAPPILRLAITLSLDLTLLTTQLGSKRRFDELSKLVGEGVVSDIWTYAFAKPEIVRATLDVLPGVVRALDVGCTRFLKMLVPQLTQPLVLPSTCPLIPGRDPIDLAQLQLQISSLKVLVPLMEVCAPRMNGWSLTILDGLARCWVCVVAESGQAAATPDSDDEDEDEDVALSPARPPGHSDKNVDELRRLLRTACMQLARVCPSVRENEYVQLEKADPQAFKGFFDLVDNVTPSR